MTSCRRPSSRSARPRVPADLRTAIDESYRYLLFPSRDNGQVATRDLGKGGSWSHRWRLRRAAPGSGDPETVGRRGRADHRRTRAHRRDPNLLGKLFFDQSPQVSVSNLVAHFATRRHWPILQRPDLLTQILVEGSKRGAWCLGRCPSPRHINRRRSTTRDSPPPLTAEPLAEPATGSSAPRSMPSSSAGWKTSSADQTPSPAGWSKASRPAPKSTCEHLAEPSSRITTRSIPMSSSNS